MRIKKVSPYFILIIILPFALLWQWLLKGEVLYWGTLLFQFGPWRSLVKSSLLNGEWPLWNPLLGNGTPLLANLQSAVFYPPNWLYLLLPVEHGLTLSIALHFALAGMGMYWYGRQLTLQPFAAAISGITFMISGYVVGRAQFVSMVGAVVWIPIAISLHEKYIATRTHKFIVWLGIALSMPLLAGHAQLWFYTLWLVGLYTLFRSIQTQNTATIKALWHGGCQFSVAVSIALLLAAMQIVPTLEFMNHSSRVGGAERTFALTYSYWPWRLITLLTPNFFGNPAQNNYWGYANYWEDHAYLGLLPLLLSAIALWHFLRNKFTTRNEIPLKPYVQIIPFFATLIPVSLILAMGWNTPVYLWVFDNVPGFGYFQGPARLLIWYTVAIAVLAGAGAQVLLDGPLYRPLWRRLLAVGVAVTIAALAGSWLATGRTLTAIGATFELGIWLIFSCALLLLRPTPTQPFRQKFWQATVVGLTALNLTVYALPLLPTLPATIFRQPSQTARFLQSQPSHYRFFIEKELERFLKFDRFFRFNSFGPDQLDFWQWLHEWMIPNMGMYAQIPTANNDDPLTISLWQQYLDLIHRAAPAQKTKLLQGMNVGYLLDYPEGKTGQIIYQADDLTIRHISEARPEAYFVTEAEFKPTPKQTIARLLSPDFDSSQKVIIMGVRPGNNNTASPQSNNLDGQVTPVAVKRIGAGRIELNINAPTAGYVVLTDTFYPGWQVTVDNKPATIWPANLAFRAVGVEVGAHTIVFSYKPQSFMIGGWISVLTMLSIGGYSLFLKTGRLSQ